MYVQMNQFKVMSRVLLLLLLLGLGLAETAQAQGDQDIPDIFLPGKTSVSEDITGSGDTFFVDPSYKPGFVVYTDKTEIILHTTPFPYSPAGLAISGTDHAKVKNQEMTENQLPGVSTLPEASVQPIESNSADLFVTKDNVVAEGYFTVRAKLHDIVNNTLSLDLTKAEQTSQAKIYLCIGNLEGTSAEQLESWIHNGIQGTCCQIPGTGELKLNDVIVAAFDANPLMKKVGILQVSYNQSSQIVHKVSIIVHKEKIENWNNSEDQEVKLEVLTSMD